jgi:putative nucleotidyltransferase with HDIG domain
MKLSQLINKETKTYNWDFIETIPEFIALKSCNQSSKWHGEGSVWNHTKLVCAEAIKKSSDSGIILMAAALFHDIGKPKCTIFKNNDYHSYKHEFEGEKITRNLLWDEDVTNRELVCLLVRYHMEPYFLTERNDCLDRLMTLSRNLMGIKSLLDLNECDIIGSIHETSDCTDLDRNRFLRKYAQKLDCYYVDNRMYDHEIKTINNGDKPLVNINVLIGLPGSGKTTFAEQELKDHSIILSRDTIREELGYCKPGEKKVCSFDQEINVTKKFEERLLACVKAGEEVTIDNMNIRRKYREELKGLLKDYNVLWHYYYIQPEYLETNIARRNGQITSKEINNLRDILSFPHRSECDILSYIKS